LIIRDLDLLRELAHQNLEHVNLSLFTLNEMLGLKMDPMTVSSAKRLQVVQNLSLVGIPVRVLIGLVIPSLNNQEIPAI